MKNKIILPVLLTAFMLTACGGEKKESSSVGETKPAEQKTKTKNDLKKMSLEGKVRTVEVNSYVVDADGKTERSVPGENAEHVSDMLFAFNEKGNLMSETSFFGPTRQVYSVKKYEYDDLGLLRRMELNTTDKTVHSLTEYGYNDKGLLQEKSSLIEQYYTTQEGKRGFARKTTKQVVKRHEGENPAETELYENDTLAERSVWKYNERGDVLEVESQDVPFTQKLIMRSNFDANGNKTNTYLITKKDTIKSNLYSYNEKGDAADVKLAISGKRWSYTYEYDEQGNWVIQNQFDDTGKLKYRIKRKYSYY